MPADSNRKRSRNEFGPRANGEHYEYNDPDANREHHVRVEHNAELRTQQSRVMDRLQHRYNDRDCEQ